MTKYSKELKVPIAQRYLTGRDGYQILSQEFMNFPELYRRIRIDTIQSVRQDRDLYVKRLDKFIEKTKANEMYGQWNDNGRLVE